MLEMNLTKGKKDHVVQKHDGIQLERHLRPSSSQRRSGLPQNVKVTRKNISVMQRCRIVFMPGTKFASCFQGLTFNPRVKLAACITSERTQESSDLGFSGVGMGSSWVWGGCLPPHVCPGHQEPHTAGRASAPLPGLVPGSQGWLVTSATHRHSGHSLGVTLCVYHALPMTSELPSPPFHR